VKNLQTLTMLLLFCCSLGVCETPQKRSGSSTPMHVQHKVSCLCGTVQVCSGDICLKPSDFNLDDDITVELRDKTGTTILDSKKAILKTRKQECTTQGGGNVPCNAKERRSVSRAKPMATISLPSSFSKMEWRNRRLSFQQTTHTRDTSLVISFTWSNRCERNLIRITGIRASRGNPFLATTPSPSPSPP
jgi:hypothetical protein